ncbi:hypothetical protein COU80_00655 [Candidatus Peregrinibacteria bacterium CG10_big_fil_rev_8_21_14_0_10_55_24]|nr:MAG: hypothetical protein COU80_00655 [Candidatus Peregrinibacteria bacterium CG10_big_fil_rev_8_21_14_0_10_55_24]
MSVEGKPKQIDQQPELPKVETSTKPPTDSEKLASHNLEREQTKAKKQDDAKISEIRASLGLEQAEGGKTTNQHLQEYLGLQEGAVERVALLKAKNLPDHYQTQRKALRDERLDKVIIAVIPDDLWVKGSQPSESSAENQLILIKQSYFEAQENPDEIAWLCHELAHCQNFLDAESPEAYQGNMQKFAFEDLKTEYTYPNNPVEQFTFTKQFQYLKEHGKSREDVLTMLSKYYHEEDFPFFNRLLDGVYGK